MADSRAQKCHEQTTTTESVPSMRRNEKTLSRGAAMRGHVDVAAVAVDDVNVVLYQAAMNNKIVARKPFVNSERRTAFKEKV